MNFDLAFGENRTSNLLSNVVAMEVTYHNSVYRAFALTSDGKVYVRYTPNGNWTLGYQ